MYLLNVTAFIFRSPHYLSKMMQSFTLAPVWRRSLPTTLENSGESPLQERCTLMEALQILVYLTNVYQTKEPTRNDENSDVPVGTSY